MINSRLKIKIKKHGVTTCTRIRQLLGLNTSKMHINKRYKFVKEDIHRRVTYNL